jgi:hypothetical protein
MSPSDHDSRLTLLRLLGDKFSIVLLANVFEPETDIHYKFDFKGSNVGRETLDSADFDNSFAYLLQDKIKSSSQTLKELDFHRLLESGQIEKLQFGIKVKTQLMSQLQKDVDLLKRHSFMDYRF